MTASHAPSPATRLRTAMDAGPVCAPGCFNGLTARLAARLGFQALYVSGGATSAAAGVPDIGLLTLDRFAAMVREVVDGSRAVGPAGLPVIADADTGFGEAEMVRRTVFDYARAGAAGLHIEDQVFPKRCGHLDGKELIPLEDAATKIRWAAEAAREVGASSGGPLEGRPGIIVCARTDARSVDGLEAVIERARAYADAGAEMIFPEGLTSEAEFRAVADGLRGRGVYLLANMTEFGKTPMLPVSRFGELGYHLVIFPVSLLRVAMKAVEAALRELHDTGTAAGIVPRMQTRAELYDLLGYRPGVEWRFGR